MSPSARNTVAWILQGLMGLAFIGAGGYGLLHASESAQNFVEMGLPGWFAYLIGAAEVLGGIGLLVPRTVRLAAAGLAVIMAGAVIMHATAIPGGMAKGTPALLLLLALLVLQRLRRPAPAPVV